MVGFQAMTERLYYRDSYLRAFRARVASRQGDVVYLDRSAFYPASGGQPCDTGSIAGAAVLDVIDEGERVAHRLAAPVSGDEVECTVDWARRFDHMQQHTGQHLLSAVFAELAGAGTVSFHLGQEFSTIDLDRPSLEPEAIRAVEERANAVVFENRPVLVSFEDAASATGLRKPSERDGTLRVVSIEALDRSACGGTHVRATGEIGAILLRKVERVRNALRVEFLCGGRAVRRARADFEALGRVARMFSASLDEAPQMVSAHLEAARTAEKNQRRMAAELGGFRGRELYAATQPDATGIRRHLKRLPEGSLDELRVLAQSFAAGSRAIYLAVVENPPSVLLAASADSGVDAGAAVKAAIADTGGRGGGTPRMGQGSVASASLLGDVVSRLLAR